MFNYSRFLLVRVNSSYYTEIYLKGYRDTHPINVLLMFQLSFCQMVGGGIREQFKWFIPDTDKQSNKSGRRGRERGEGGGGGGVPLFFHQYKTVCTLFLWIGPSISSSHLHSWIDLILSKDCSCSSSRERAHCDPLFIQANLWDQVCIPCPPSNGWRANWNVLRFFFF